MTDNFICACCGYATDCEACYWYHMTMGFMIPENFEKMHRFWAQNGNCPYKHIRNCKYRD